MSPSRPARLGARVALSLGAIAALGSCDSQGTPPPTGSVTIAVRADVTGFFPNPPIVNEGYTFDVNWHIFEGLVRLDRNLEIRPALAERWENPDDYTYVFRLRSGLRFSDGRLLTARDVAASIDAASSRGWVTQDYFQAVESIEAVGERDVVVRTRFPYVILLSKLPWGLVLPAQALDTSPVPLVGTGPYRLEAWDPGKGFVLSSNPHFRGPAPHIARARFVVVPNAQERIQRLLEGTVDIIDHVPLRAVEALRSEKGVEVITGQSLRVLFLGLRVDKPPLSDPRVREAIDLAIDRAELIRRALFGHAEAASQLVPRSVTGYNPEIEVTQSDVDRGRQLLAEAGYPEGFDIRLDGPNNRYVNDNEILAEVARQLARVGIRVEVNAMDKLDFFPLALGGRSRFFLLGWACQTGEAGDVLDAVLRPSDGGTVGDGNVVGLSDSELNRLIEESNASLTLRERTAALQAAMARATELRATIPLVIQCPAFAVSRRIIWDPPLRLALNLMDIRFSSF